LKVANLVCWHADYAQNADPDACFAIKQLEFEHDSKKNGMTAQEYEVGAFRRLNRLQDMHLIRLLATYEHRGHFHLILPWADGGNLKDLWETQVQSEARHFGLAMWMSAQLLGLARALQKIHYCREDLNSNDSTSPDGGVQEYGRHGDLKPENILWFKDKSGIGGERSSLGTLKIADFGFADFHSKHSRSNVQRSAVGGFTQTYSAPEFDVDERVSPQYDIWSFGCIMMQFVVWYLQGWAGVEEFSKARAMDSKGALIPTDTFFAIEDGGQGRFRALPKQSVIQVSNLSTHQDTVRRQADHLM
jgi:serine/threonine protein kinase